MNHKVTLADVFDPFFEGKKFDSHLGKAIYRYQINYLNSNKEYIEFYGSNLLGVHRIRFKDNDMNRFFDEVLDIDYLALSEKLKTVTDINQEFKVSSDELNLTLMYLLHRFGSSKIIDGNNRKRALYDCALLFFYRTTAALISNLFKYPADPKIAQKAYANLSNKFLIKQLGSWGKVMDYRANKLINEHGLHYKNIIAFKDDLSIVYAINDSQGRIREMIKSYYGEFKDVHDSGESIGVKGGTYRDIEGEEVVKEKLNSIEGKIAYMKEIVTDEHSFVKDDLIGVISKMNTNVSFRSLKSCLSWLSQEYSSHKWHKDVDEFMTISMIHSFHLIQYNICPKSMRDYPSILNGLKNLLASSRSVDKDLIKLRDLGDKIVKASFPYKISEPLVIAIRSSLVLYLVLRVLVGVQ